MSKSVFISIVIPAYNEEKNISFTLSEVSKYLREKDFFYEIILIDDGSTDKTVQKAQNFERELDNFRLIRSSPNRGKGYVLKKAMLQASGDYVMFMDADSSVSINELDKFLSLLDKGFDIYIASRKIPGARVTVSLKRKILGDIYIFLAKGLLGIHVSDINCGFKLFKQQVVRNIFSKQIMDDWSFDAEVLFIAEKSRYRIKEIPVDWVHKTTSKVRPIKDGIGSLLSLIKIKQNALRGKYS